MKFHFLTWFIVVKHEEEIDKPRQLQGFEHLSNKTELTEVYHKPRLLLRDSTQGKLLHGGDVTLLGEDIVLQLDIERAPVAKFRLESRLTYLFLYCR